MSSGLSCSDETIAAACVRFRTESKLPGSYHWRYLESVFHDSALPLIENSPEAGTSLSEIPERKVAFMNITLSLAPLISLIAGILILVMPRLLNFIVAIYLIAIGLIGLFGLGSMHFR
jgi:hypothetical protein